MTTNIDAIVNNLSSFYQFEGKSVIHVGAGGGQLIGYAFNTRTVLAVDPDPGGVSSMQTAIERAGLEDRFSVIQGEFASISAQVDVVFFEFCLHEISDPAGALLHAQTLAPEILVLDHLPDSRWAWYVCEEEKAARSWAAVRQRSVIRESSFEATQHFDTYRELFSKIQVCGEQATNRIRHLSEEKDIRIEMGYAMALIRNEAA